MTIFPPEPQMIDLARRLRLYSNRQGQLVHIIRELRKDAASARPEITSIPADTLVLSNSVAPVAMVPGSIEHSLEVIALPEGTGSQTGLQIHDDEEVAAHDHGVPHNDVVLPVENPVEAMMRSINEGGHETGQPVVEPLPERFMVRVATTGRPHRATKRNYDYFDELNASLAAIEHQGRGDSQT